MKVVEVVAGLADETAGTSYAVHRLCESIFDQGCHVELHALNPLPTSSAKYSKHGYSATHWMKFVGMSPSMFKGLADAAQHIDIVHNHGLWLMPNIYASLAAKRHNRNLIISPHGMLSPWALGYSRFKKRAMWYAAQKWAINAANCLHATADIEYKELRELGLSAPVAIIPNGVDLPRLSPNLVYRPRRQLLFLARIHEIKGVDILLRAWSRLESLFIDWDLCVTGPDNGGYLEKMKMLAYELRLKRVRFTGPVLGTDKSTLFFSSDLYVLPTHSENFGLTVAEALAHGLPAITTKGAPWQGLVEKGCGWWIDIEEDALVQALKEAMNTDPDKLLGMGKTGKEWIKNEFSWQSVGERMHITYEWLISSGKPPAWVRID